MKRFLFCILSILLFNFTDTAAMQNEPQESAEDLKNEEKMKQVSLHCCQADHKINIQLLWFLLLITLDNRSFHELKYHIKNDSAEELNLFVLQLYQEERIPCATCQEYSDYYIPKEKFLTSSFDNVENRSSHQIDIIPAQKNPIEKPTQKSYGNDYSIAQQFQKLITSQEFLKNPKKFENAQIVCFNCNHITTADKLWAYCMAYNKVELSQELLSIFNNGLTQDLALFTLKTYTELEKKCFNCFQYKGYYIPEFDLE